MLRKPTATILVCAAFFLRPAADDPGIDSVRLAQSLASCFPELSPRLSPRPDAWRRQAAGWVSSDPRNTTPDVLTMTAQLPEYADEPVEVRVGANTPHTLVLVPLQSRRRKGTVEQGRAVYRGVREGTDAIWVTRHNQIEWFYLLHSAKSPNQFQWHLVLSEGLGDVRNEPSGALALSDRKGTMVARIPPLLRSMRTDSAGKPN